MGRRTSPEERWPCPCCGHLTLAVGPGDYDLCPVCFWEDDGGQLMWPLSDDGANGISLVQAQQHYRASGACHPELRDRVRPPRPGEPVDPGWRPLDLDVDDVPGRQEESRSTPDRPWPADGARLYWWRPGYFRAPGAEVAQAPHATLDSDSPSARLMARVMEAVPETCEIEARLRRTYEEPAPMAFCAELVDVAFDALDRGDVALLDRLVQALDTGLTDGDPQSHTCVAIGFFEDERWSRAGLDEVIARWPRAIRREADRRRHFATSWRGRLHDPSAAWRHPVWWWRHRRAREGDRFAG